MALQIRGEQLTGIGNSSIKAGAEIDLAKLNLTQGATFSGALVLSNNNEHSGILSVTNSTDSTSHSDGSLIVSGGVGIAKKLFVNSDADISGDLTVDGAATVGGSLTITGDLQVDGTMTTINSTELTVDDKNIIVASGSANSAAADGAGLTIDTGELNEGDNPQLTWYSVGGTERFELNKAIKFEGAVTVDNNMTLSSNRSLQMTNGSNTTTINLNGSNGSITSASVSCSGDISSSGGSVSAVNLSASTGLVSPSIKNASSGESFSVSSAGAIVGASLTSSGQIQFGTLKDGAAGTSIGGFVPSTISSLNKRLDSAEYDTDTSIPTTAAIVDYIDYKFLNTSLSGDVTGDLTGDIKSATAELVLDNGTNDTGSEQGLRIYSADGLEVVLDAGTDGSNSYFEGDIRKQDGTVIVDFDESNGVYFQGQVSDITNHGVSQLSDVDAANFEAYDFLMYDGSNFVNVIEQVVFHTVDETTNSEVTNQAVVLSTASDDTFAEKANVFLNGQKLRHGTSVQVGNGEREFYFDSANSKIHFSASLIAADDELEIRYIVDSDA